jgi:hypothetical protein
VNDRGLCRHAAAQRHGEIGQRRIARAQDQQTRIDPARQCAPAQRPQLNCAASAPDRLGERAAHLAGSQDDDLLDFDAAPRPALHR